jgi:hypothetical protein
LNERSFSVLRFDVQRVILGQWRPFYKNDVARPEGRQLSHGLGLVWELFASVVESNFKLNFLGFRPDSLNEL